MQAGISWLTQANYILQQNQMCVNQNWVSLGLRLCSAPKIASYLGWNKCPHYIYNEANKFCGCKNNPVQNFDESYDTSSKDSIVTDYFFTGT